MTKDDEEEQQQQQNHEEEEEDENHDDDEEADAEAGAPGFKDSFFESFDRVPSGVSFDDEDLHSSDSESDDDVRFSFASAVAPPSFRRLSDFDDENLQRILKQKQQEEENGDDNDEVEDHSAKGFDYGIWMAEPMSIKERRMKLLQGMGLASSKNMPLPIVGKSKSRRIPPNIPLGPSKSRLPSSCLEISNNPGTAHEPVLSPPRVLARSRSDTHLALPDLSPFAQLFRVSSAPPSRRRQWAKKTMENEGLDGSNGNVSAMSLELGVLKIKNLDTGKEFVVSSDGKIGKLNDRQTGLQFTMDEFEKFLGFSPIVKEVMRRVTDASNAAIVEANSNINTFCSKSRRSKSTKKKVNWLKNIKFVASTVTGLMSEKEREKEKEALKSSERLKVHQHGKSYKELTGLYMCQDIQAHQGSIWTMKFSCDSRYLASAGEDRVVHIWQVVECDTITSSLRRQDQPQSPGKQPPLSNGGSSVGRSNRLAGHPSKRTKKGKGSSLPDYIVMPETIFSLSSEPFCSFEGHLDDVLDLSWSKSQFLLSSSMDKTVRLWDIETKACLKLFAHNDYVTCIQFNPTEERYFISGSLDSKVRIWSIPDRQVVDWSDLHEMVTAACYTPDGQGAVVGSHKGSCRFYNTADAKLTQEGQIDIRAKKKKSNAKKITGFQFTPDNPSEVLITSADSQIRVFDGVEMIHKYRGFRNISSQISASCTMDGKYVVCASEDSHVYIWKRDRSRTSSGGKSGKVTSRSYEHFFCKDVSVAIPWPNGAANCEPSPDLPSWSRRFNDIRTPSNLEDMFPSSRSQGNPEDIHNDVGSLSFAGHASVSSSSSSLSSWGWGGGSNRITAGTEAENSWGLVVVTAGLGGNIRVYQNFGLPVRLSRQANLF